MSELVNKVVIDQDGGEGIISGETEHRLQIVLMRTLKAEWFTRQQFHERFIFKEIPTKDGSNLN